MTLIHLWLVHRFKADSVHYVTPTEDNQYQTFREVNQEVGQIIVADVNRARIEELLAPGRVALGRLIWKEGQGGSPTDPAEKTRSRAQKASARKV